MSAWLGVLIVVAANVVAVVVMLYARGRAPEGGYYDDTQQAGWVYSVAGTSFAVILAFVFLLTYQSFDRVRTSASTEADATLSLFRTAGIFPAGERDALQGALVCYGTAVVALEWPALAQGETSPVVPEWVRRMNDAFREAPPIADPKVGAAYDAWFSLVAQRQAGRQGRLDEAQPFVPTLVWVFLLVGGALVVGFVWLFADRTERRFAQAALPVGVTTVVASGLILVAFFDAPYHDTPGAVKPISMERSIAAMRSERPAGAALPCDVQGRPT